MEQTDFTAEKRFLVLLQKLEKSYQIKECV